MITARFSGDCIVCHDTIDPGQEIDLHEDGGWAHTSCLPEPAEPKHREVCPVCHTMRTVTGACLCEEDQ